MGLLSLLNSCLANWDLYASRERNTGLTAGYVIMEAFALCARIQPKPSRLLASEACGKPMSFLRNISPETQAATAFRAVSLLHAHHAEGWNEQEQFSMSR